MIKVEEWIKESKEIRTHHLNLNDVCIERGGNSTVHRGILAQYLNTNIPQKIHLCHRCHNDKCSNPKHLYWGTCAENIADAKENGTWSSIWIRTVKKYGFEEACAMNSRTGGAAKGGAGNKGKPKTQEHRDKISKALTK